MSLFIRKLQFLLKTLKRRSSSSDDFAEEKWIADFSKEKHTRFDIKSEASYDASLRKSLLSAGHSLVLALKKIACIAWVEAPEYRYRDLVVSGSIRIDAKGGYGASGMLFRMLDSETYYSLLISSKGYFRLDLIRNKMPFPLIGWTELPLSTGTALNPDESVDFSVIVYGSRIVLIIRGRWAAEITDSSIQEGTICFIAASYVSGDPSYTTIRKDKNVNDTFYTVEAFLESLTVESRITEVSSFYEQWRDSPDIDPKARLCLAETFSAMGQHNAAMVQLSKAWDAPGYRKTQGELLLAGRLAQALGLLSDAESYIGQCLEANVKNPEGRKAIVEMAGILNEGKRFKDLKNYCVEALKINPFDSMLWNFLGHAHWNFSNYKKAVAAYNRAFQLDGKNGILAKNAANVYDVMGFKSEALARYIEAARAFMKESNFNDLGLLVPKLLTLGAVNWEARSLAGKWAFAVEDLKVAEAEFAAAEKLRKAMKPKQKKDGAQVFLEALLLIRKGKRREAIPLLEEAVSLEKDYALFHFRLAENLFLLENDPNDSRMLNELNAALALSEKNFAEAEISTVKEDDGLAGWINNFAAQLALRKGNLDAAVKYLEKAALVLGDLPAVLVNRAVLFYLRGSLESALELLECGKEDDPDGVIANCSGNLLVRSGRFEEADEKYRRALAASPDNVEYLCNRAACLMKLGLYGEADELLGRVHSIAPSTAVLEMISYVAAKKGEYMRAEQACQSSLEMDPSHAPSLLSLGWIFLNLGRHEEAADIIVRLDKLELREDIAKGLEDLRTRLDERINMTINCASCDRHWKVKKENPPTPAMKLYAMPPDDLPAGSCTVCGKTYCIGCAKENIDLSSGRFICSICQKPLKLNNESLKKIIHDWAVKDGLVKSR